MYAEECIFRAPTSASESVVDSNTELHQRTIKRLKQEFLAERETYLNLSKQKEELTALLQEVQMSLFNLRLNSQKFESLNLNPLADTVARVSQQITELERMCIRANGSSFL
jgi:hypothetical protein